MSFLPKKTMSTPKFFFISFCSSSLLAHTSRYFFK
ncbi:secreted protein [gut metagenome]|uniref:Secreted protein n=1 Tax=gut metagenome TaxID=749906 RepID=J9FIE6_9ZZZZ